MDGSLKFLSGTRYEAKPNTKLSHVISSEKGCSLKYEAITNLWNETWNALTGLPVKWQPTPNPPTGLQEGWDPSTDVAAVQTQLKGSSREHRITTCDATRPGLRGWCRRTSSLWRGFLTPARGRWEDPLVYERHSTPSDPPPPWTPANINRWTWESLENDSSLATFLLLSVRTLESS